MNAFRICVNSGGSLWILDQFQLQTCGCPVAPLRAQFKAFASSGAIPAELFQGLL